MVHQRELCPSTSPLGTAFKWDAEVKVPPKPLPPCITGSFGHHQSALEITPFITSL